MNGTRQLNITLSAQAMADLESLASSSGKTMTDVVRNALGLVKLAQEVKSKNQIFNKAVIPLVEKLATFATTVFGPLLAFIWATTLGKNRKAPRPIQDRGARTHIRGRHRCQAPGVCYT